jgi:alpha-glucosidase
MAAFYGTGADELTMAFNFVFMLADFDDLPPIVARTDELLEGEAWPVWAASNHDVVRFPTRWCGGDEDKARVGLMMLLTLRGTPVLYYGDELLARNARVPDEQLRDEMGRPGTVHYPGRDGARTPMPWTAEPGAGFTRPEVTPWLPLGDYEKRNVEVERTDPESALNLCRSLVAARRASEDLRQGEYEELAAPDGVWLYRRGAHTVVALNLTGSDTTVPLDPAGVTLSTRRERPPKNDEGLVLRAHEGIVVTRR